MLLAPLGIAAEQQSADLSQGQNTGRRIRLYLKDGTYQMVTSYQVKGDLVEYRSAERGGDREQIPLSLVDLAKTQAAMQEPRGSAVQAPVLDPELAQEEQDRLSQTPEVAKDLRLPQQESLLALDAFEGTPELVPLTQTDGDLNRQTAHNILRQSMNPFAHAHQLIQINGSRSHVQLHVDTPVFYLRMPSSEKEVDDSNSTFEVDTHGATDGKKQPQSTQPSQYVIVRADVRKDVRIVSSFEMNLLGSGKLHEDVVETRQTLLPGGHWMKIEPTTSLLVGEYAILEVLNDHEVNLGVWDFGVHPSAPESDDAMKPRPRHAPSFGSRE